MIVDKITFQSHEKNHGFWKSIFLEFIFFFFFFPECYDKGVSLSEKSLKRVWLLLYTYAFFRFSRFKKMKFSSGQIFVNGFSSFSCFNFSFLYTKKHRFFSINWQVCLIFLDSFLVSVFQRQILSRFFCRYLHIFVLTFGGKFNISSRKWQFLSTKLIFRRQFSKK